MEQLIALVSEKTGLDAEKAKQAVETVLGFLKDKLPEPIAGQVESLISGEGAGDLFDKGKDMLGGMFGK